ncbi:MAG: TonB-dependent receptor [Prevotellaceae bacterium]|nr:TonB-dependent receptor [Prevotellaceae bacterium]
MALPALCPLLLWAQAGRQDTITGKVHQIDSVTVTARRVPRAVSATMPLQTLSYEQIDLLGIQDMADAVRRFAGVNVKDYGGIGGLKTVSIRNMGAAHTAVSYDGVVVSNCQAGQIDIGRFSLDNVEMLSLAVGQTVNPLQAARLYTSAGVLSIETEKPHFDNGKSAAVRVMVRGGSFGYITPSVRWWQRLGGRTRLAVSGNYMRADGNYPFTLVNGKYTTRERRDNSQIYSWQAEASLYHTFKRGGDVDVKGYGFYSKRGLPGAVTLYNPLSDETLWDKNFFLQARYKKQFDRRWSLMAQGKYNYGWNRYEDQGAEYTEGNYRERHTQQEYYLSAAVAFRPTAAWSFSLAEDGAVNTLDNTLPACPFPTRYSSYTALSARYRRQWLSADVSAVYTATSEHVKTGTAPDNFHRLAPSASLTLQPWQEERLYLRLMYKSTFRLPTFNDLYYYRLGNRSLNPEKAREYNAGLTWDKSGWRVVDYLTLTVDGYYNDVTDKIVAFPTTYAWKMANYGTVHAAGVDATVAVAVVPVTQLKLLLSGSYAWQRAIDLTDSEAKNYKDQLPYTPRHSGNASLLVETPWVTAGYSAVAMGKRYYLSQNIPENEIAGYVEHTLSLSRQFTFDCCKLKLQAEVVNLTDKQYDVIKYYPMPGRSWRLTGTVQF